MDARIDSRGSRRPPSRPMRRTPPKGKCISLTAVSGMIDTIQFLLFVQIRTNNGPNRTALPARCFWLWVTVDTSGADEEPDTNSKTIRRLTGVSERTQFQVCALLRTLVRWSVHLLLLGACQCMVDSQEVLLAAMFG